MHIGSNCLVAARDKLPILISGDLMRELAPPLLALAFVDGLDGVVLGLARGNDMSQASDSKNFTVSSTNCPYFLVFSQVLSAPCLTPFLSNSELVFLTSLLPVESSTESKSSSSTSSLAAAAFFFAKCRAMISSSALSSMPG